MTEDNEYSAMSLSSSGSGDLNTNRISAEFTEETAVPLCPTTTSEITSSVAESLMKPPLNPASGRFVRRMSLRERGDFFGTTQNASHTMSDSHEQSSSGQSPPSPISNKVNIVVRTASNDAGDFGEVYVPQNSTNLKYLPVDMLNAPNVKNSIAKSILQNALSKGVLVIKHGRHGKPKKKYLYCNSNVSELHWYAERKPVATSLNAQNANAVLVSEVDEDGSRSILISDIISIRLGTELDPASSEEDIKEAAANGTVNSILLLQVAKEKQRLLNSSTTISGIAGGLFSNMLKQKESGLLYGSSILRRHCKSEEMKLSFSLVLRDRTFDIQCFNKKDYDLLTINLKELIRPQLLHTSLSPISGSQIDLESSACNATDSTQSAEVFVSPTGSPSGLPPRQPQQPRIADVDGNLLGLPKKSVRFSAENMYSEALVLSASMSMSLDGFDSHPLSPDVLQVDQSSNTKHVADGLVSGGIASMEDVTERESEQESGKSTATSSTSDHDIMYLDEVESNLDAIIHSPVSRNHYDQPLAAESKDENVVFQHNVEDPAPHPEPPGSFSLRMTSSEALQIGIILAEQERRFATNMYVSLQVEDDPKIGKYIARGYTTEEAILRIFEKKFMSKEELVALGRSMSMDEIPAGERAMLPLSDNSMSSCDEMDRQLSAGREDEKEDVRDADYIDEHIDDCFKGHVFDALDAAYSDSDTEDSVCMPMLPRSQAIVGRKSVFAAELFGNRGVGRISSLDSEDLQGIHVDAEVREDSTTAANANREVSSHATGVTSTDALQIGLLLSQQEQEFGTNMFESLTADDEAEMQSLRTAGYSLDQAALEIFSTKFAPKHSESVPATAIAVPIQSSQPPPQQRRGSSFFPDSTSVLPNNTRMNPLPPRVNMKESTLRRMNSHEALQLALLLSDQEARHGINMYDSLQLTDEPIIQHLIMNEGKSMEEAVLEVFNRKVARQELTQTATAVLVSTEGDGNKNHSPFLTPMGSFHLDHTASVSTSLSSSSSVQNNENIDKTGSGLVSHQLHGSDPNIASQIFANQPYPQTQAYVQHPQQLPPAAFSTTHDAYAQQQQMMQMQMQSQQHLHPPQMYGLAYPQYPMPVPQPMPMLVQQMPPNIYGYMPQHYAAYPPQPMPPMPGYYPYGAVALSPGAYPQGSVAYAYPHASMSPLYSPHPMSPQQIPPIPTQAQIHAQSPPQSQPNSARSVRRTDSETSSFYGDIVPLNESTFNLQAPNSAQARAGSTTSSISSKASSTTPLANTTPTQQHKTINRQTSTLSSASTSQKGGGIKKLTSRLSLFNFNKQPSDGTAAASSYAGVGKLKYKESDVKTITNMGFTRDQAVWALLANDNNIVMAINSLTS